MIDVIEMRRCHAIVRNPCIACVLCLYDVYYDRRVYGTSFG